MEFCCHSKTFVLQIPLYRDIDFFPMLFYQGMKASIKTVACSSGRRNIQDVKAKL